MATAQQQKKETALILKSGIDVGRKLDWISKWTTGNRTHSEFWSVGLRLIAAQCRPWLINLTNWRCFFFTRWFLPWNRAWNRQRCSFLFAFYFRFKKNNEIKTPLKTEPSIRVPFRCVLSLGAGSPWPLRKDERRLPSFFWGFLPGFQRLIFFPHWMNCKSIDFLRVFFFGCLKKKKKMSVTHQFCFFWKNFISFLFLAATVRDEGEVGNNKRKKKKMRMKMKEEKTMMMKMKEKKEWTRERRGRRGTKRKRRRKRRRKATSARIKRRRRWWWWRTRKRRARTRTRTRRTRRRTRRRKRTRTRRRTTTSTRIKRKRRWWWWRPRKRKTITRTRTRTRKRRRWWWWRTRKRRIRRRRQKRKTKKEWKECVLYSLRWALRRRPCTLISVNCAAGGSYANDPGDQLVYDVFPFLFGVDPFFLLLSFFFLEKNKQNGVGIFCCAGTILYGSLLAEVNKTIETKPIFIETGSSIKPERQLCRATPFRSIDRSLWWQGFYWVSIGFSRFY